MPSTGSIVGSPATAIEELDRYHVVSDMDEVLLMMHFPEFDPEKIERSIRLLTDEVLPHSR